MNHKMMCFKELSRLFVAQLLDKPFHNIFIKIYYQ